MLGISRERLAAGSLPERGGFTLLELIIVLVVLVALAALVVPTLGFVRDQADSATSAAGSAAVLNNLEIFRASTGRYPARMDSLLDTNGEVYVGMFTHAGVELETTSYADHQGMRGLWFPLTHNGGPRWTVDHDPNAQFPNESTQGMPAREMRADRGIQPHMVATVPRAPVGRNAREVVRMAFPNQVDPNNPVVPPGFHLVVFGVGERNAAVGSTMASAPIHSGGGEGYYNRYLAIFRVNETTERAQLVMVTDSNMSSISRRTSDFRNAGPRDIEADGTPEPDPLP